LILAAALAACGGPGPDAARREPPDSALSVPPARTFGAYQPVPPQRPNAQMARDFLDLSFRMESGRALPVMTRFDGPVGVTVKGPAPAFAERDLDILLARLRTEAGLNIARRDGPDAEVTIEFLPRRTMQALVPQAACFVAPNVSSWAEYRRARATTQTDWTALERRMRVAVFIPGDVAPQEVRDCLNEEIAQGLGPINDLYRLPDSVFNDDNVQGLLTGFDMLMLRVYYAPELANGMTEEQAATVVPSVLARLNPGGGGPGYGPGADTPRSFQTAIEGALGPRSGAEGRRESALRAVSIASEQGWTDTRAGFAWFVLGRLFLSSRPDLALDAFVRARAVFASGRGMEMQAANVAMQLAAFALAQGDAEGALRQVASAEGTAMRGQNAALLSTLLLIRAEALDLAGRTAEATAARTDGLAWARYGFGSAAEARDRMADIAALSPARRAETIRRLIQ
jgi:hypothetical protein